MAFRFSRAYVEYIHDEIVPLSVEPGDEPVHSEEYRDKGLIESACARPFQSVFGEDAFPSISEKAAAFFHSLICNHCFGNGNKRTALAALDMFLTANDMFFFLDNDAAYHLAKETASHNADGRHADDVLKDLAKLIAENSMAIEDMLETDQEYITETRDLYDQYILYAEKIRSHPLNREVEQQ